jgi:protocatechuate 3,4-dioxygenase beta subunit
MIIDLAKKTGIKYHFPMKLCCSGVFSILLTLSLLFFMQEKAANAETCTPTPEDQMGPFYKPNAPMRSSVGKGYVLQGIVRSSKDCGPLPGAIVELWLAGPDGGYDDAHRATIIADTSGRYRFESNVPPPYYGRPPHIHLRVSAQGHATLVTQYYPVAGKNDAVFDIVLVPSR